MAFFCRHLFCKVKLLILPLSLILLLVCLPGCVKEFNLEKYAKKDGVALSSASSTYRRNIVVPRKSRLLQNESNHILSPTQATSQSECGTLKSDSYFDFNFADNYKNRFTGFVLALNFHEQQTQAVSNLFALQCWAKALQVNVVEPFMVDSFFTFPMNASSKERHHVRFRDVFNHTRWNQLFTKHKLAPLASWEQFVAHAPRRLIVVRFRYLKPKEYKLQKKMGMERVHRSTTKIFKTGCHKSAELSTKLAYMVEVLNFTVVRDVCLNFAHGDQLTASQFNSHVYGGTGPRTVAVLMEEWRGFSNEKNGKRVSLHGGCWLSARIHPMLYATPSRQLICDAHKYRKWYLRTESYITLVVRTEKMHSLAYDHTHMAACLNNTLTMWRRLKKATKIHTTFLSIDIGKFGSYTLMERKGDVKYNPYKNLYTNFMKTLFGPHATLRTWELGFEEVASNLEPGYVASLQKTIASMAKCAILSGGGSFQKHILYLHRKIHHNNRPCVIVMEDCSRGI